MNVWEKLEQTNSEAQIEQKRREELQQSLNKKNEELRQAQKEVKQMLNIYNPLEVFEFNLKTLKLKTFFGISLGVGIIALIFFDIVSRSL